eukprot:gene9784-10783_t
MSATSNPVPRLYRTVVDEVVKNVREAFLNEGVDEQVLQELKQLWESKLLQSRAIDFIPTDPSATRINLTYPHSMHASNEQSHTSQKVTVAGQIVGTDPQTGHMVYVSHPANLANVGQLSAPAAQAALAIQGTTTHHELRPSSSASSSRAQHLQIAHNQQQQQSTSQLTPQQQQIYQQHMQQVQQQHRQQQQMQQKIHQQQQQQKVIIQHQQQQQQQQQKGMPSHSLQIQQPKVITSHSLQKQQQKVITAHNLQQQQQQGKTVVQNIPQKQAQQQQQHIQQNVGIQVLQGEPSTTAYPGLSQSGNGRGPRQIIQVDGANDSSSEDDNDNFDDLDHYPINIDNADVDRDDGEEGDSLNSADDIDEDDPSELFDTENVVVCQYDKIARSKNKWKFYLKDGIMNLRSKDFVFHKANGESEW